MNLTTEGRNFSIGMHSVTKTVVYRRHSSNIHCQCKWYFDIILNATGDDVNSAILGSGNQVTSGELPSQHNVAIVLPGSLFEHNNIIKLPSVGTVFGIYESTNLFPVAGTDYNDTIVTETGSQILSAIVGNGSINLENLREPVSVTLRLNINDTVSTYL